MKFTIPATDLAALVGHAVRAVPARPLNPVMAAIRLTAASHGEVFAAGYDYDNLTAAEVAGAEVAADGSVLVPGRLLAAMAANLDGQATVHLDGARLRLASPGVRYAVAVLDEDGYPGLPPIPPAFGEVDAGHLAAAIEMASTSARGATGAPWWYGVVRLENCGEGLLIGATDTVSATRTFVPWAQPPTRVGVGVGELPTKLAADTVRGVAGRVAVVLDEVQTGLQTGGRTTLIRRATGWPKWREITDAATGREPAGVVTVGRKALLAAMARCAAALSEVTDLDAHAVLTFTPSSVSYEVAGNGGAECQGEVDVLGFAGEPLRVGVWPAYLRDAVAAGAGETVEVAYTAAMRPLVIREPGAEEYHLAMPKRLRAHVE